jgi:hypothetical protein
VHGDVPSEPPEWRAATDASGKEFVDIIYEKAVGEGIAKVRLLSSVDPCEALICWIPGKKSAAAAAGFPRTFRTKLVCCCCLWIARARALCLHLVFFSMHIAAADHHKPA